MDTKIKNKNQAWFALSNEKIQNRKLKLWAIYFPISFIKGVK